MKLSTIEQLVKLISGTAITEVSWNEGETQLTIKQGGAPAAPVAAPAPAVAAPVAQSQAPAAEAAPAVAAASGLHELNSPMVGTLYTAPNPDSPEFVKVGDRIKKGQVLCIIEAMKLMNEIESDTSGVLEEICISNESPVEFGTVLFRIKKD